MTLLYDEVMAPSGLRITQFNLLSELERRDAFPPTVGELAEILTMERSALGQTLKLIERDGLIALARDERDARPRPVRLTGERRSSERGPIGRRRVAGSAGFSANRRWPNCARPCATSPRIRTSPAPSIESARRGDVRHPPRPHLYVSNRF
jgi:DNA-binding transcriptional ArsR family regulator